MDVRKSGIMVDVKRELSKVRDFILVILLGSILVEAVTGIRLLGKWWQ